MPDGQNKHSKMLDEIIKVCQTWKKHIDDRTSTGKELAAEFDRQDIIDLLGNMF